MKKILLLAVFALFAGSLSAAAFELNSDAIIDQVTMASEDVEIPLASKPLKMGRYVRVDGYVTLRGNGWMPSGDNGGYTSVSLSGSATFRDSSGQVTSNYTYINTSVSMWVRPNQYVSQTVWPNVRATFYRNGKILGSTTLNGSISVSGWPSSSYFSLNGSGYLSGSIYVEDED